jgi:GDP-4-dehydro-6-deoxy-D-mannose reductase
VPGPILVTGAAGFAGSHLVDHLLALEDVDIVAWDRAVTRGQASPDPGGRRPRSFTLDLLDREAVARAVADLRPAIVIHCAGAAQVASAWRETTPALETNVLGTHFLLEGVRRARLDARVVVIGSALVYRASADPLTEDAPLGPSNPYGVSKLMQELVALDAARDGLPVVAVRPFNHIGPRQQPTFAASSFARQIALAEAGRLAPVLKVGNLDARRDLTDVRDTVRAYRLLARHGRPGLPYNVCSGHAPSMGEVLERLRVLARIPIAVEVDPALLRPSDNPIIVGDARRLREETGWQPAIPLDRTLRDLLDHWRASATAE